MTALSSERLLLREFVEQDAASVHSYARDPEVVKHMPWGPNTENDTRDFIQRAVGYQLEQPRTHYELAVTLRDKGVLIGGCGIRVTNPVLREGNFGYCLNKQYWGNGYATEAAETLLDFGFGTMKLHRIYATCDPENHASRKVLEKNGLTQEGHLRENLMIRDVWRDSLVYAILDREWRVNP